MTDLDTRNLPHDDADAVAAIRGGDSERYAELVQRHQRRVFAIAWSRLGDASLAEEATQESFIRGYQRLSLLGDGRKFAGWIASIARHTAINLGLSHRRELARRVRWSLEPVTTAADAAADPISGETLRATLEALPAKHRECLVLFYLEGKSGEEAAKALGITEAAFRVRLHRAKGALREQLEQTLTESLEKLRPSSGLAAGVMGAVLASSSAKAATAGAGATVTGGALGKLFPFGGALPYFSWAALAPTFLLARFYAQKEAQNFRDAEGFRARLFRAETRTRILWMIPILVLIAWILPNVGEAYGFHTIYLTLAIGTLITGLITARRLAINRHRYLKTSVVSSAVLSAGLFAVGLHALPLSFVHLIVLVTMVLGALSFADRPLRMDYSLFLRAAAGLLARPPAVEREQRRLSRQDLLRYARFLGDRWLVINFRWHAAGLALRTAPVHASKWGLLNYLRGWAGGSQILLSYTGEVWAKLAGKEAKEIQEVRAEIVQPGELEDRVSAATAMAWKQFRAGQFALAESTLCQTPDREVFKVPPAQSGVTRWHRRITLGFACVLGLLWTLNYLKPPWMSGLQPVQLTEAEARQALANWSNRSAGGPGGLSNGLASALSFALILPPAELFTPASWVEIKKEVLWLAGFNPAREMDLKYSTLESTRLLPRALNEEWISLEDLGLTIEGFKTYLTERKAQGWKFHLVRYQLPEQAGAYAEKFEPTTLARLSWLRKIGCLDLVDRKELIRQAASWQVLSGTFPDGRARLRNWRDVHGLFVTGAGALLQDTYCQLAALEILGGLDQVDRAACIQGILRLHHGRGYFAPPDTEKNWQFQVRGDARDTISAFESLRILGALDQVKDLARWDARPARRSTGEAERQVQWEEIEAWLLTKRIDRKIPSTGK